MKMAIDILTTDLPDLGQSRRDAAPRPRWLSRCIGDGHPIAVQSMTATKTQNIEATVGRPKRCGRGAGVVRIAVDSDKDAEALAEIRRRTSANLSVDLQENFRLAEQVAPHVDKIRYNPGHLYHHERDKPWQDKVRFIIDGAAAA
jgi:(E)-4-hydroxy-3-methylbut-2-enyl-diphosphate synthase